MGNVNDHVATSLADFPGSYNDKLAAFFSSLVDATSTIFTNAYPTTSPTLANYVPDPESTEYLVATLLTQTARVTDLNALRIAYENLRVHYEDLLAFVGALVADLQSRNILN